MSRQCVPDHGLVIVDMQNAFCHPDGAVYVPQALSQLALTADLAGNARAAGMPVIYTTVIWHNPEDIPARLRQSHPDLLSTWDAPGGLSEACWGAGIADPIAPRPGEHVLRRKGLRCPGLAELTVRLGLSTMLVTGTTASNGVYAAALSLSGASMAVLAIEDCISDISDALRQPCLDNIARYAGSVVTFDDYCKKTHPNREEPAGGILHAVP